MISLAYVEGYNKESILSDSLFAFESAIENINKEIDNEIEEYIESVKDYEFLLYIGEAKDDKESKPVPNNIFQKIGDSIKKIADEFRKFIQKIITDIKDSGFKTKSDIDKIEKYCKEHPEFKDDVKQKFAAGELDVSTAKNIAEIQKAYDELIKYSVQKDVNASDAKKKFAQFKEKLSNIDKSTVVKTAAAATTVIGVGTAIYKYKSEKLGASKNAMNLQKANDEYYQKAMEGVDSILKSSNFDDSKLGLIQGDNLTKAQIIKNGYNEYMGFVSKQVTNEQAANSKLEKFISFAASKIGKVNDIYANRQKDQINIMRDAYAVGNKNKS